MQTKISEELTISAEFQYDVNRLMDGYSDVYVNPDAWYGINRWLNYTKAPLYIVSAHYVYGSETLYLSERYVLTKDGFELDEADPANWLIFTDLDEARRAVAETIVGEEQPRQVALVTITH